MKTALKTLKEKDIKVTFNRIILLEFLQSHIGHYSIKDIYNELKKKYVNVNLASLYNNIELFYQKGLVLLLTVKNGEKIWDTNLTDHAHFICEECGKIIDLNFNKENLNKEYHVGKITRVNIIYYGICNECLKKSKGG